MANIPREKDGNGQGQQQEAPENEQQQHQEHDDKHEKTPTAEEKIQELTDLLQRTQANMENYRKQAEKRMEDMQLWAGKQLLLQLLPIIDEFELALKKYDARHVSPEFVKGIELIYAHLIGFLETQGVQPLAVEGEQFDPYQHEALLKVASEAQENTIIEEFQKGYVLHGQVLRHARVKLSAGRKKRAEEEQRKAEKEEKQQEKNQDTKNQHKNRPEE